MIALAAAALFITGWLNPEPKSNGKTLSEWLRQLRDSNPAKRQEAAAAVQSMGPDALPYLTGELAKGPNAFQRGAAAASRSAPGFLKRPLSRIAQMGNEVASKHMALQAIGLMGSNGAPAVPAVGEVLRQMDVGLMSAAATTMIYLGTNSLPELIAALDDGSFDTRSHACFALGALGTNAAPAVPRLRQIIEEERGAIAAAAATTLARIGDPAVPTLTELVGHTNSAVRRWAITGIESMSGRPTSAAPVLIRATQDEDPAVRAAAVSALGGIDRISPESTAALVRALKDPNANVRMVAAHAAKIWPRVVRDNQELFRDLLEDEVVGVRAAAAHAIGNTGQHGEWAIPRLTKMLEETNSTEQAAAAYALATITNSVEVARGSGIFVPRFPPAVKAERLEMRDQ